MRLKEINFKIDTKAPFTQYCKENGFELIEEIEQSIDLFNCQNRINARIVTTNLNGFMQKSLDFKGIYKKEESILRKRELGDIIFVDDKLVIDALGGINYIKTKTIKSNKTVYKKKNIIFEIIEKISPDEAMELEIVGNPWNVRKIAYDIQCLIDIENYTENN